MSKHCEHCAPEFTECWNEGGKCRKKPRSSDGSVKRKIPRAQALAVAEEMVARLSGACARIAIVGSLRRGNQEVGDVELLFVPRYSERPDGLFSQRIVDVADEFCDRLLKDGVLAKRPNKNGHPAGWGASNKLAIHCASGIPVDLFSVPGEVCLCVVVLKKYNGDYEKAIVSESGAVQSRLRCLWEKVSRQERQSVQQKLQHQAPMERGEGAEDGAQPANHELLHLRDSGSKQNLLVSQKNLLGRVQKEIASPNNDGDQTLKNSQGCVQSNNSQARLHNGVVSRKIRCGEQAPLRNGTSSNNGEALGEKVNAMGNSPSPQRNEERQPNSESGNRDVENTHGQRSLSSLPERVQNKITCPLCYGSGWFAPNWWVSLVIRTGSKDTCLALTMGANRLGRSLVAYGAGVKLPSGEIVWATSEEEVFTLCGCKYLPPEER